MRREFGSKEKLKLTESPEQRKTTKEEIMGLITKKEITQRLENLKPGECLKFRLSATFGDRFLILEQNPLYPQKGQKKYVLLNGKDEASARSQPIFYASDKAKKLAEWVADRSPRWITETEPPLQKAA
jgi:hypothetical protein